MTIRTHTITITTGLTRWSRIVPDDTGYGQWKDFADKTFGFQCDCGLWDGAIDGASTSKLAKLIAEERHESEGVTAIKFARKFRPVTPRTEAQIWVTS